MVWPAAKPGGRTPVVTLMCVSPTTAAAARLCAGERSTIAVLFSRTVFATPTLPTSQPARVNGTHGAGRVADGSRATERRGSRR